MKKLIYSFLFLLCSVFALQAESMVVATYNLRNANAGDSTNGNGWGQRYPYIAQLIQFHGFDIFGTSRSKYQQLQDLKNAMPGYDYIGVGRDDGKQAGEHSAIFYRKEKFEVLDHGDFWLSTITDRPIRDGMPFFPVFAHGVNFGINKPALLSCSLTYIWIILAYRPVRKARNLSLRS